MPLIEWSPPLLLITHKLLKMVKCCHPLNYILCRCWAFLFALQCLLSHTLGGLTEWHCTAKMFLFFYSKNTT